MNSDIKVFKEKTKQVTMIRYIGIGLKLSHDFLSVGADYLKEKLHLVNNQLI